MSLFQHPHSTVTLVISIQTNLVTYVKQLVSCKWLSHNHRAPTACRYCSFECSKISSPCLVSIYISISILFQLEHPLAIYSFLLNPAFESFSSNVTLHSSMWMPVARPSLSILFQAFGSRCPNRLCHVCMQF